MDEEVGNRGNSGEASHVVWLRVGRPKGAVSGAHATRNPPLDASHIRNHSNPRCGIGGVESGGAVRPGPSPAPLGVTAPPFPPPMLPTGAKRGPKALSIL